MITDLIGKTFRGLKIIDPDDSYKHHLLEILVSEDGKKEIYAVLHEQGCCELVELYSMQISGSPVNEKIVSATSRELENEIPKDMWLSADALRECDPEYGTFTWTVIQLGFGNKGSAEFWFLGSSNGYYSESVEVIKLVD